MNFLKFFSGLCAVAALLPFAPPTQANVMYRCPGNDYNNTLTAKQATDRGCKTIEGAPITIIQGGKPKPVSGSGSGSGSPAATASTAGSSGANKIDPAEQRTRDSDARRILEGELKREEERLTTLRTEFNSGEPERRGDEKNYQKYLERVSDMKAALARKENDIVAIKRELAKLPS
jgi:hypothetical protein